MSGGPSGGTLCTHPQLATDTTDPPILAIGRPSCIGPIQWMPALAMSLSGVFSGRTETTPLINAPSYWFKMLRINAVTNATKVIKLQSLRNRTNPVLIRHPVGHSPRGMRHREEPVPIVRERLLPKPATLSGLRNIGRQELP